MGNASQCGPLNWGICGHGGGPWPWTGAGTVVVPVDSDAYSDTIGEYWRFLLTDSAPEVQKRVWADLEATPKEIVVSIFRAQMGYDPLPTSLSYRGPVLSVITPSSDAPFGLHNLGADLPHTTFTGTGHWLHMDKPEEFNAILDEFLTRAGSAA